MAKHLQIATLDVCFNNIKINTEIRDDVEESESNVTRNVDGHLNDDKKNVLLSMNLISINIFSRAD